MNETIELDLRELGKLLLKRIWIIILCAVVVGTAVLIYTANYVTPLYKAEITLMVNGNTTGGGQGSSNDLAVALRQVETHTYAITSNTVLDAVAEATGLNLTGDRIRGMMTASAMGETEMFKVSVLTPDPQMSADIANVIADVAPGELAKIIHSSTVEIVDYARVPKARYSPNYATNTVIGAMCGAVLAAAVIILQSMLDVRVKKEEDLTKIFAAPVLGIVPELAEDVKKPVVRKERH